MVKEAALLKVEPGSNPMTMESLKFTSGVPSMTINLRKKMASDKGEKESQIEQVEMDDNMSENLIEAVINREHLSSHKVFRSYSKLEKSSTLRHVILICFTASLVILPGILDFFLKRTAVTNFRLIESATQNAKRLSNASLASQSIFHMKLLSNFNSTPLTELEKKLKITSEDSMNLRSSLQEQLNEIKMTTESTKLSLCEYILDYDPRKLISPQVLEKVRGTVSGITFSRGWLS